MFYFYNLKKHFTLRNAAILFITISLTFVIRSLIVCYFDYDLNSFKDFFITGVLVRSCVFLVYSVWNDICELFNFKSLLCDSEVEIDIDRGKSKNKGKGKACDYRGRRVIVESRSVNKRVGIESSSSKEYLKPLKYNPVSSVSKTPLISTVSSNSTHKSFYRPISDNDSGVIRIIPYSRVKVTQFCSPIVTKYTDSVLSSPRYPSFVADTPSEGTQQVSKTPKISNLSTPTTMFPLFDKNSSLFVL